MTDAGASVETKLCKFSKEFYKNHNSFGIKTWVPGFNKRKQICHVASKHLTKKQLEVIADAMLRELREGKSVDEVNAIKDRMLEEA